MGDLGDLAVAGDDRPTGRRGRAGAVDHRDVGQHDHRVGDGDEGAGLGGQCCSGLRACGACAKGETQCYPTGNTCHGDPHSTVKDVIICAVRCSAV